MFSFSKALFRHSTYHKRKRDQNIARTSFCPGLGQLQGSTNAYADEVSHSQTYDSIQPWCNTKQHDAKHSQKDAILESHQPRLRDLAQGAAAGSYPSSNRDCITRESKVPRCAWSQVPNKEDSREAYCPQIPVFEDHKCVHLCRSQNIE